VNVFNITVNITVQVNIGDVFGKLKQPAQDAMSEQYLQIVQSNFGPTGIDRPWPWDQLSDRSAIGRAYIKKVGRTYATLYETGALFNNSLSRDSSNPDAATVTMRDTSAAPYATRHHYGAWPLPPRRVFPMRADGSVTADTGKAVTDAAQQAINEVLS
jgi:hypothetical protein